MKMRDIKKSIGDVAGKMVQGIPHERLIVYLLIAGFLPLLFVGLAYFQKKNELEMLSDKLSSSCFDITIKNKKELSNRSVRAQFQDKDQFYLIKQIESMQLLSDEVGSLKRTLDSGFHQDEEAIRARYNFLSSTDNNIVFAEGPEKRMKGFRETEFSLLHPVEVNLSDMQAIIAKIEGVKIGALEADPSRPHLFFSDFRFEKKKVYAGEVFSLSFKVVKREYVS